MTINDSKGLIGILSRGDNAASTATPENSRLSRVFTALETYNVTGVPVVYSEDSGDETRQQLMGLDGVLVWVNPIENNQNRTKLDLILRDVASHGVWVSAHPDTILKMGTKEVLYQTRHLGWGADTRLYNNLGELQEILPPLLKSGPRVLKQLRSSGGDGVWKIEMVPDFSSSGEVTVRVLHAARGSVVEEIEFSDLVKRMKPYFAGSAKLIDQPFQSRLGEGAIRCYLTQNRVIGFGFQYVKALMSPSKHESDTLSVPPRIYYGPEKLEFQSLRTLLESEWVPQMQQVLDIDVNSLPAIWDADFFLGSKTHTGKDTYVLGEINVQSVFPFPDEAVDPLVQTSVARMLVAKKELHK